jgi:DNA-binding MarR family transcriptional regulator
MDHHATNAVTPETAEEAPSACYDSTFAEGLVGYNLRRAYAVHMQRFTAVFGKLNIRPVQFTLLGHLYNNPGLNQSQMGRALDIQRANLVTLLDELEQRGLVRREMSKDDRRSRVLSLTADGKRLTDKIFRLSALMEQDLDNQVGKEQRLKLVELLRAVRSLDPNPSFDVDDASR